MTLAAGQSERSQATRSPRRVAVVPVYNEEPTVVRVLGELESLVDEIVVVDDGSTDRSRELILQWAKSRTHVQTILFNENRGLSAGYHAAFSAIRDRVYIGDLDPDDAIVTVDADGQHEPQDLDKLVAQLYEQPCDAVVARRDLSGYSAFKRLGNFLLSAWASLWAGCRLYDVESGFRVFRAGPLAEALDYYHGYRYSETVEVAVVLARLGYRIANDVMVPVPVSRSRTRLLDGVIDALTMVGAWWRTVTGRHKPDGVPALAVNVLPALPFLALAFISVDLLINPLFLAADSMHHYAHVWYISRQIFDHGQVPLHISLLDNGSAVTFPYAIAPYLLGAALYPLLGDSAVTLLMVTVVLGIVFAAGLVRPVMRDPWFALIFMLNPFFIDAIFAFQFAGLWSALFFFLFVWAFERRWYVAAGGLAWLTASSHPVLGTIALGGYGLFILLLDREKLRPLATIGVPVAVALVPVYWMTLQTPARAETSDLQAALDIADTFLRRGSFVAAPFLLSALAPQIRQHYLRLLPALAAVFVVGFALQSGVVSYSGGPSGYYGVAHRSSDIYAEYFESPFFVPGATYRVLEPGAREDGMYRFIRHGAVLSNEFFTESLQHRTWTEAQYQCYTAVKQIDFVVIETVYAKRAGQSEGALLESLAEQGGAHVTYTDPRGRFRVYDVSPFASAIPRPHSIKDCGIT